MKQVAETSVRAFERRFRAIESPQKVGVNDTHMWTVQEDPFTTPQLALSRQNIVTYLPLRRVSALDQGFPLTAIAKHSIRE